MSSDKFRLIGEAKVGTLEGTLRDEWDRLYAEQQRLLKAQAAYEEGLDAFVTELRAKYGSLADSHTDSPRFRIAPEGDVYLDFCECPVCQAHLHQMTVADTVEEMFKSDLIPDDAIAYVRQRARAVDNQYKVRKKMFN